MIWKPISISLRQIFKIFIRSFLGPAFFFTKKMHPQFHQCFLVEKTTTNFLQVNLFHKHLFLHQLTHSMTKDCSLDYKFRTCSEHVVYINCSECQNKKQFLYTKCIELAIFMHWTRNSMNNLLSYCGLVDARISAYEKKLPVHLLFSNESILRLGHLNDTKLILND